MRRVPALACGLAAGALMVSVVMPGGAAQAGVTTADSCAHVLMVGARGSGEAGPGTPGWTSTPGDPHGLGRVMVSLEHRLLNDLHGYPKMQVVSVRYPALAVPSSPRDDWGPYFRGLAEGVSWTTNYLNQQEATCPSQEIVLAGYSQGAMVMHRVLIGLENGGNQTVLGQVSAVVLVGDGDQVPNDLVTPEGTAGPGAEGIGFRFPKKSGATTTMFDDSTPVWEVCNEGDPVCDFSLSDFVHWQNHVNIHINSYADPAPGYGCHQALCDAADAAALELE
jgi:hypothetical protein